MEINGYVSKVKHQITLQDLKNRKFEKRYKNKTFFKQTETLKILKHIDVDDFTEKAVIDMPENCAENMYGFYEFHNVPAHNFVLRKKNYHKLRKYDFENRKSISKSAIYDVVDIAMIKLEEKTFDVVKFLDQELLSEISTLNRTKYYLPEILILNQIFPDQGPGWMKVETNGLSHQIFYICRLSEDSRKRFSENKYCEADTLLKSFLEDPKRHGFKTLFNVKNRKIGTKDEGAFTRRMCKNYNDNAVLFKYCEAYQTPTVSTEQSGIVQINLDFFVGFNRSTRIAMSSYRHLFEKFITDFGATIEGDARMNSELPERALISCRVGKVHYRKTQWYEYQNKKKQINL
jgi:hypothetical protein